MNYLNNLKLITLLFFSLCTEHHVTGSLGLARRPGGFSDGNSILSPRSSDSGMQAKIVEYVLGGSPNAKDLDSRMRHLVIVSLPLYLQI